MRKKVCVDISLFSVFSYHACAIASEVINLGQIKRHLSILQPQIMLPTKCQVIWCISKDIIGIGPIYNFWHIWKKVWGREITSLWCLKAPSPATKKWIFEFCTKFGFRNHLQTFWPRWLVKCELSLGRQSCARKHQSRRGSYFEPQALYFSLRKSYC